MIRLSMGSADLSDSFLRRIVQLGVDCVDLGCPPLDGLSALKKRIRSFGLDVNSVFLPDMSAAFMGAEDGSGQDLEAVERTLRAYGDAGLRLVFQRYEGNNFNHLVTFYESVHRGGYCGSGKIVWLTGRRPPERPQAELRRVGFAGCLSPDHVFRLEGDPDASADQTRAYQGLAFSIGYMKALLAALATV